MRVGIDAHKMKCTTVMFDGDSVTESFDFQTTRQGVYEFMEKVPEGSIAVIESRARMAAMMMDRSTKNNRNNILPIVFSFHKEEVKW